MLRVEVRHAADARRVPPAARPAPGVADGYCVGQGATVTVSALTALISIHGCGPHRGRGVAGRAAARGGGAAPRAGQEAAVIIDFNQY